MRIWCALSNRKNSNYLFNRISQALISQRHELKFSGYSINYPINYSFYCLDNIASADEDFDQKFDNREYWSLLKQIKDFSPDLILSDLDPILTFAAFELNKPVWQISPLLLYFGLDYTFDENTLIKKHKKSINKSFDKILGQSSKKLIYSPFGDFNFPLSIKNGFEWVSPFHLNFSSSREKNKTLLIDLYQTSTLFFLKSNTDFYFNQFTYNFNNYRDLINQCHIVIHDGLTDILTDVLYNQAQNLLYNQTSDAECYINYLIAYKFGLAQDILNFKDIKLTPQINQKSVSLLNLLI